MYSFLYPLILLLILPIILGGIYMYFKGGKSIEFNALEDLKLVYKNHSYWYKLYVFIGSFILILFVIIFSGPISIESKEKVLKNGIDIEIVLDVSYSMNAQDILPNRLQVAKSAIISFLEKLTGDRVGIIVFAGRPFSSLPLNFDYNIVSKIVERINLDTINQNSGYMQGTAIGDALILAADNLADNDSKREKVIILLTDGTTNKGLTPEKAIGFIKNEYDFDIKIYTIGIGGDEDTYTTVTTPFGLSQNIKIQGLDEESLKQISEISGGQYFRAKSQEDLEGIFYSISQLEKREIEVEEYTQKKSRYNIILYLLGLCFLFLIYIKDNKKIQGL